ncbi:MAG: ABC transporter substrate-binding protein [Hyphomicrobiaceae bacterium]|nr:ABC transporter substrate-binding protein [Hyphomicrobiaceae bacterium]
MKGIIISAAYAAALTALSCAASRTHAQDREIVIGMQCDRTGPTQIVGTTLCPAYHDYVSLVNSKGGVEGFKIRVLEIDHEYKVPPAIEAHERFKKEGAIFHSVYGTPQIAALARKLEEDKMAATSPGFGSAAAADGKRYPYIFPIAATYWSQAAVAVKFVKDTLGGNLKGRKIAYLFYDNPAGKEPIGVLEDLAKREGFEMRTFGVPAPGIEMGAQVLDISARFKPDFVIAHLFGRAPSVAIKEFKGKGFPLNKVIGLVWASSEADIIAAGGWAVAEGYHTLQYAGVGRDFPVIKEIEAMYKAQGKQPPKESAENSVVYNRGVFQAAVQLEAIRHAIKAKGGTKPTAQDVRDGFERIKGFTLGGLAPPMELTPADHEGGGWVQVWTVKGGKFVKSTEWQQAYRDVIRHHLELDAKK